MNDWRTTQTLSAEPRNNRVQEYKISKLVISVVGIDKSKTNNNFIDESLENKSDKDDYGFKYVLNMEYPKFKSDFLNSINESLIESGVHYIFEDVFDAYFVKEPYIATQMLQRILREYYDNVRIVKAVLHVVSHYSYSDLGEEFTFPVSSLFSHQDKRIRKFALKVFDNWDSAETLHILKGTKIMSEKWLNDYKEKIMKRLEREQSDAILFAGN